MPFIRTSAATRQAQNLRAHYARFGPPPPQASSTSGGSSNALQSLIQETQQAQQAANQANEQRYAQLLQNQRRTQRQSAKSFQRGKQALRGSADASIADAEDQGTQSKAQILSSMGSRGLGNSTLTDSLQSGVDTITSRNVDRIRGNLGQQLAGLYQNRSQAQIQTGNAIGAAIEGRFDEGPNLGQYSNLIQQLSQAQNTQVTPVSGGGAIYNRPAFSRTGLFGPRPTPTPAPAAAAPRPRVYTSTQGGYQA